MPMKLCSPWIKLYREVQAMFEKDEDITVVLDEYDVRVYVKTQEKADALGRLLNYEYKFGNVVSHVHVLPANGEKKLAVGEDEQFKVAFEGNSALKEVIPVSSPIGDLVYVIFNKEVVQYRNDDLGDYYGNCSTLYQEIAKDIFISRPNLFYCTDIGY